MMGPNGQMMGGKGEGSMGDSPIAQWLMNDARERLADTMKKLNLDS